MAPVADLPLLTTTRSAPYCLLRRDNATVFGNWRLDATPEAFITEAWSEGLMVGALMIMGCITVANMRKGVILHKLILTEAGSPQASVELGLS
jgi:hypothetical protein